MARKKSTAIEKEISKIVNKIANRVNYWSKKGVKYNQKAIKADTLRKQIRATVKQTVEAGISDYDVNLEMVLDEITLITNDVASNICNFLNDGHEDISLAVVGVKKPTVLDIRKLNNMQLCQLYETVYDAGYNPSAEFEY